MPEDSKQERPPPPSATTQELRDSEQTPQREVAAAQQQPITTSSAGKSALKTRLAPQNTSADASPYTSRNTSPVRKDSRPPLPGAFATQPSAAAIQRALSAASVPQLQPTPNSSDSTSRLPRAQKSASASAETTPTWPVSPRLKSPAPSSTSTARTAPSMSQQTKTPTTPADAAAPSKQSDDETARRSDQQLLTPSKAASRGPSGKSVLETVQENSTDAVMPSPAAVQASHDMKPLSRINDNTTPKRDVIDTDKPAESGNESAGNKSDGQRGRRSPVGQSAPSAQKPKATTKNGYGTLASAKSRGEGKQGMTVETETVSSIPQSALNPGDRNRNEHSGSLRLKPSSETIRPKKDRKKATQKPRSITQGTASSKADFFEARVASAVDAEAHSSDSDDTFVYESNPPERHRARRHHSRTPSVTSAHSTADQRGVLRNIGDTMDDRKVAGKRSMKFSSHNDHDGPDSRGGTVRSHRHRRMREDREGAQAATGPEQDSPFTQASKLRNGTSDARSRPNSPRSPPRQQQASTGFFSRKTEQSFDFDGEGADDERTPLIPSSLRTTRSARSRRAHGISGIDSMDDSSGPQSRASKWRGLMRGICLGLVICVCALFFAVIVLFFWNRPLYDVDIKRIDHVLASQEELMLDIHVVAVNPNALSVSVPNLDLNVFAKSKHVGKSRDPDSVATRRRRYVPGADEWEDLSDLWRSPNGGVDHGTDPPKHGDLEPDSQTMLLGRIFHFDQALTFEPEMWRRQRTSAVGELSLAKPGNRTEVGGSKRWERVLQFPFELIVRGTLKYRLPISTKIQSVAVEASVIVHPEDGVDRFGNMRLEKVDHREHWQWIEWPVNPDDDDDDDDEE